MTVLAPERIPAVEMEFEPPPSGSTVDTFVRWLLACCALGAAVVHVAYAPTHFAEYWMYGLFFVGIAWVQVLFAAGLVFWPRRIVLALIALTNAAVIGVWIVSRTIGIGIGPHAKIAEAVTFPDILATALEGVVLLGALALLANPRVLGRHLRPRWLTPVVVSTAGVLIAGSSGYAATPHFVNAHTHSHAAVTPFAANGSPCEEAGPPASQGQVFNPTGHSHRGPLLQQPIGEATRQILQTEQEQARAVAAKYPTVADAERAGYRMSTPYVPCIGAHYTNIALAGKFDPAKPSELLYDATTSTAHIVGLSYLVYHPGGAPEGFAGPNDVWHQHTFNGGLCVNAIGVVVGAESTSPARCEALGGKKIPLTDIWMLHDWVVPGFECSWGTFAAECPELGGRIGGTAWDAPDPKQPPIPLG
jgi:hypothetical protein